MVATSMLSQVLRKQIGSNEYFPTGAGVGGDVPAAASAAAVVSDPFSFRSTNIYPNRNGPLKRVRSIQFPQLPQTEFNYKINNNNMYNMANIQQQQQQLRAHHHIQQQQQLPSQQPLQTHHHPHCHSQQHHNLQQQHHQWYNAPQSTFNYVASSNSREMRNKAEKQRRDRINSFIGELHTLVPLVSKSAKRMDKTSILRLTAAHLRIYHILAKTKKMGNTNLPKYINMLHLDQLICEEMGSFFLVLNPDGKIIFISESVELLLGHLQTDLLGQSLYTVTLAEDHERLRSHLRSGGEIGQIWRKNVDIRIKRAGPRSETPVYETVRLSGIHVSLPPSETNQSNPILASTSAALHATIDSEILVFVANVVRPESTLDTRSLMAREEYVTRNLIDGRIIACDQRMSYVTGYMINEVQGRSGFMFMHRDDLRWVIIALRQSMTRFLWQCCQVLYNKRDSRGDSCYRLKSRNNEFIYLKTVGFLEIDDSGVVESFICLNIMVDEKEGEFHMEHMKKRFGAAYLKSFENCPIDDALLDTESQLLLESDPLLPLLHPLTPPLPCRPTPGSPVEDAPAEEEICLPILPIETKKDSVANPLLVQQAINEMIQDLPLPITDDLKHSTVKNEKSNIVVRGRQNDTSHTIKNNSICQIKTETDEFDNVQQYMNLNGKRILPMTFDSNGKRSRISSVSSDSSTHLSPVNPTYSVNSKGPPVNNNNKKNSRKLADKYLTKASDLLLHQRHRPA